jgi:hypothetical protein
VKNKIKHAIYICCRADRNSLVSQNQTLRRSKGSVAVKSGDICLTVRVKDRTFVLPQERCEGQR